MVKIIVTQISHLVLSKSREYDAYEVGKIKEPFSHGF